jgi:hypothetical protein
MDWVNRSVLLLSQLHEDSHIDLARKKTHMERTHPNIRLVLGIIFSLVVVVGTAYFQSVLRFSTYIALFICIIASGIFFWIVNGSD